MPPSWLAPSAWALAPAPSTFLPPGAPDARWSNADLDPVPPARRTWTTWKCARPPLSGAGSTAVDARVRSYVAYWISDATNVAAWELASCVCAF
jgi:NCS1 family nucleobase:cation symporter-1